MVGGLLVSLEKGCNFKLGNLNPVETFEGLNLLGKYGVDLAWYTFGDTINVILKHVNKGENQIFMADNKIDVESIINKLVNDAVTEFGFEEKDQKEIYNKLKKHGCCYF